MLLLNLLSAPFPGPFDERAPLRRARPLPPRDGRERISKPKKKTEQKKQKKETEKKKQKKR
jgi:hypothetical protein